MSLFQLPPFNLVGLRKARRVLVVDSNNIGWRCWHSKGYAEMRFGKKPSGHVFGFVKTMLSFLGKKPKVPTAMVFAVDGYPKAKYDAVPEYKGNRESDRTATGDPMPEVTRLVRLMPGYFLHHPEQEADDVMAAFIRRLRQREKRSRRWAADIRIVSSDNDLLSALGPGTCRWRRAHEDIVAGDDFQAIGESLKITEPLRPEHVPLFKAITGDSSDNIKGVPRIRKARLAQVLMDTDGSPEAFIAKVMAGDKRLSDKERNKLHESWEGVVKRNHNIILLNTGLRVWPTRNTAKPRLLQRFVVDTFGCKSLADDLQRMTPRP